MSDVQQAQQKYQQFLQLLPLTITLAGLPQADLGKYFNDDQLDVRSKTLRNAYKHARKLAKELIQE